MKLLKALFKFIFTIIAVVVALGAYDYIKLQFNKGNIKNILPDYEVIE